MSAHLMGYYDNVIIVLTVLSIVLLLKGRLWLAACLQAVSMFVHESSLLVGFPLFCFAWWLINRQRRKSSGAQLSLTPVLLPVVAFIVIAAAQSIFLPADFELLLAKRLSDFAFIEDGRGTLMPHWLTITFFQYYGLEGGRFIGRLFDISMWGLALPSMLAVLYFSVGAWNIRIFSAESIALLGVCLIPQALHAVAVDTPRIWTYSIVCSFLALWISAEIFAARRAVSFVVRLLFLAAMAANIVGVTPLMDGQNDHFSLAGRLLLYAPVIGAALILMGREDPGSIQERVAPAASEPPEATETHRDRLSLGQHHERWILAGLAVVFVVTAYTLRFTVDDAYIAMRYSRHFAEGNGLVYNLGERVEGYTSLLWVLVLAGSYALGFGMVTASHVIGIALSALTLILVYRMAASALPPEATLGRLFPVLFLATSWIYAGWATGGLETALFAFVSVLAVSHLQSRITAGCSISDWLPLICLLLVLTRPEGMLMAGVLGVAALVSDVRVGRRPLATITRWLLVFVLPLVIFEMWRLRYYGEWLPNTFYVKVNKVEYVERGWPFFVSFAKDSLFHVWGPVALAAVFFRHLISTCVIVYSALYIAYTIWVGGDWMGYRFYQHLLPLLSLPLALVVARGVHELKTHRPTNIRRALAVPVRSALLIACAIAMAVVVGATVYKTYGEGRATRLTMDELDNYEEMDTPEEWAVEAGQGIDAVLRPGEAASASFAGFTAVYTDHTVVDSLGLTDKYVARLPAIRGGPGHEKLAPTDYLVSRYVLLVNPWPGHDLASANRHYAVEYAPGRFLYFDALVPPARVVELFYNRGFKVWLNGETLLDR